MDIRLCLRFGATLGVAMFLAGCAVRKPAQPAVKPSAAPAAPAVMACKPAGTDSRLVGVWQSNTRPRGVAGEFTALISLAADGTMGYTTQLKIGKRIRPGLRESGCWQFADGVLAIQTTKSNGELVDVADPIYQNSYRVEKIESNRLSLREMRTGGQVITARRMPAGYRLPY